jgi:hypothetical protein
MGIHPMSPLDAVWHLIYLFLPALGTAALAAAAAKLLWRRELSALRWSALAGPAAAGGAAATLAGLWLLGRDGRMLTYGAIVAATAFMLWWRGFWRRR